MTACYLIQYAPKRTWYVFLTDARLILTDDICSKRHLVADTVKSAPCRKRLNAAKHRTTTTVKRSLPAGGLSVLQRKHRGRHTPSGWTWAVLWPQCGWLQRLSPPRRTPSGFRPALAPCKRSAGVQQRTRPCSPAWQPGPLLSPGHRLQSGSAHKRGCRGSTASPGAWCASPPSVSPYSERSSF